jgi:hypothetical protein
MPGGSTSFQSLTALLGQLNAETRSDMKSAGRIRAIAGGLRIKRDEWIANTVAPRKLQILQLATSTTIPDGPNRSKSLLSGEEMLARRQDRSCDERDQRDI